MPTLSKTNNLYPILWGLLLLSKYAAAQQNSIFDIINYQEVIKINLSFDLSSLQENRRNKDAYPGLLTFLDQTGQPQSWQVDMSLRGKFRRQRCQEMPPLTYGRAYLGFPEEVEDLRFIFNEMLSKRKELMQVIRKCKYLRASSKKEMEAYINFFFEYYKDLNFSRSL